MFDSYETMESFLDVHGEYEAALNCQVSTYNHPYDNLHAFTDYLSEVRIHNLAINLLKFRRNTNELIGFKYQGVANHIGGSFAYIVSISSTNSIV